MLNPINNPDEGTYSYCCEKMKILSKSVSLTFLFVEPSNQFRQRVGVHEDLRVRTNYPLT